MPRYVYRGGRGVRAAIVLRLGRPVGWGCTCALAFFIVHPCREPRRTNRCRSFTRHPPDSMLRLSSCFTGSSASAETFPAASGRCGRRVRAASAAQTLGRSCVRSARPELRTGHCPQRIGSLHHRSRPLFVLPLRTESPTLPRLPVWPTADHRDRGSVLFHSGRADRFLSRFCPLFNLSFCTVSPSSLPYTTPEAAGGRNGRRTVLFCFREAVSRFGPSDCISGNSAALGGIREGGRTGNPVPRRSPRTLYFRFARMTIYSLKIVLRTVVTPIFKYLVLRTAVSATRAGHPVPAVKVLEKRDHCLRIEWTDGDSLGLKHRRCRRAGERFGSGFPSADPRGAPAFERNGRSFSLILFFKK